MLFSSSSTSVMRVMSSAYLKLLIFLPEILIPACASSSWAFHMMYSAYKLNKQADNIQPLCTPFPMWNQSAVSLSVLTVVSWPEYRFLRRQVRWSGIPIAVSFPQFVVIHTVKGLCMVNKAEEGVFLEFSSFFYDPTNVDTLISGSSAFSKSSLNIWNFTVHVTVEDLIGEITLVACEMSARVWEMHILWNYPFFGLEWIWPFQSCGYCWIFQIC